MSIFWPFENNGRVDVQNGRIRFSGPVTDRGGEFLTSGARLDFHSDTDISIIEETSVHVDSDGIMSINSEGDFSLGGELTVDGELFTETPVRSEGTITLNDPGTIIHGSP